MSRVGARMRAIPTWQITLFVALVSLGFLIATGLAVRGLVHFALVLLALVHRS